MRLKLLYFMLYPGMKAVRAETLLPLGKLDPGLAAPEQPLDVARVADQSRTAERLGYHAVLMEETKDDPFQILALAAQATEHVHVGTSVAIAFARSPFVVAQAAWTLQKISGGRFELGLGSQVRGHIRRRFGLTWHPPGPWMADYVGALRAIWASWQSGAPLDYASAHYNLNLNVPLFTPAPLDAPDIPIQIAAVNPYMASIAARVADGVRLHPVCSPRYIRQVIEPAVAPHRQPGFEVCLKPLIATAADSDTLAKRVHTARQRLAFYCSTPAYAGAFSVFGLEDLCAEMAQMSKTGQWDALAEKVDDDLLHSCVVVAKHEDLAGEIKARYGELLQRIEVSIPIESQADAQTMQNVIDDLRTGN